MSVLFILLRCLFRPECPVIGWIAVLQSFPLEISEVSRLLMIFVGLRPRVILV